MRGIGRGQTIELYIIPEVEQRIALALGDRRTGKPELDVPAWLLVQSMRMESLQFVKLASQELANVWRRRALAELATEAREANALAKEARVARDNADNAAPMSTDTAGEVKTLPAPPPPMRRLRRFGDSPEVCAFANTALDMDGDTHFCFALVRLLCACSLVLVAQTTTTKAANESQLRLRRAIALFREPITFDVSARVPQRRSLSLRFDADVAAHAEFATASADDAQRVQLVASRVASVANAG